MPLCWILIIQKVAREKWYGAIFPKNSKSFSLFRRMRKILFIVFLGFFATLSAQESIDLLTVSGRYALPQSYNEIEGEATESVFLANGRLPIVFSDKTIWYNNVTYTYSRVKHDAEGIDIPLTELHGVILQTGLVRRIDDRRAFQFLIVPRLMTDGANAGSDAWQLGGIAMYEQRFNEKLRMRFGFMANREMSGPLLVPLIDVLWNMSERWSLSGLLPIYGKLKYQAGKKFSTGIAYFGLITSYALSDATLQQHYMERTSIDFSLFGRWRVFGDFHLEGRLGYALDRNYERYSENDNIDLRVSILKLGDKRGEPLNATFSDGPFAELRLVYNLPLPDSAK